MRSSTSHRRPRYLLLQRLRRRRLSQPAGRSTGTVSFFRMVRWDAVLNSVIVAVIAVGISLSLGLRSALRSTARSSRAKRFSSASFLAANPPWDHYRFVAAHAFRCHWDETQPCDDHPRSRHRLSVATTEILAGLQSSIAPRTKPRSISAQTTGKPSGASRFRICASR